MDPAALRDTPDRRDLVLSPHGETRAAPARFQSCKRRARPISERRSETASLRESAPPDLLVGIRRALNAGHPLELLELVSTLLTIVDLRTRGPFPPPDAPSLPARDELVASFLDVSTRETSALVARSHWAKTERDREAGLLGGNRGPPPR